MIHYGHGSLDELRRQVKSARANELALVRRALYTRPYNGRVQPSFWESVRYDVLRRIEEIERVQSALCK
jgi:hypothetical protein